MKRKNATRNALFTSILSLLLCVSMLVGTTFAWFTDSVASGSNVIKSGNLDIVLEYWDGTSWIDAEGQVIPFVAKDGRDQSNILWEPGCTYEMAPIRVRNEGNLNAKILILLNGVTGSEKLMEAIELKTKVSNIPESLLNGSAGNVFKKFVDAELDIFYGVPEGNVVFDHSLAGKGQVTPGTGHTDTSPEFTLFGHMAEEAGNEYQNLSIEGISITVIATQQTYEKDSFGPNYDKDAEMPVVVATADDLKDALEAGKDVTLAANIALTETVTVPAGVTATLNLNGHNITAATGEMWAIQNEGKLTINGEGSIVGNGYTALYSNGNLTVNGGNYYTSDNKFGLLIDNIYGTEPSVAVINGGTFSGVGIYNPTDVTINGGIFNEGNDPDGAKDDVTLFVSPTFVGAPNTANVTLNGGTFNGDIYVYDDGITETVFVNNGATITGSILDNA